MEPYPFLQACPPGQHPAWVQPGDVILTHTPSFLGWLIRTGQRIRYWRKAERPFTWFNHAALVVGHRGELIEALGKGIVRTHLSRYEPRYYVVVRTATPPYDRAQVLNYAHLVHGANTRYGFVQFISIGLALLTGSRLTVGLEGSAICSGFVAEALARSGHTFLHPSGRVMSTAHVMPADLAINFRTDRVRS